MPVNGLREIGDQVCNEIYLEMRKIAKHLEHADVMLLVNPDVARRSSSTRQGADRWKR